MKLSAKITSIAGSQTVAFTTVIQKLRAEGRQIIDLAVGEPQFDTPAPIIDATQNALAAQKTRYSPVKGLSDLRTQLAAQFEGCDINNILITNGSKQALYMIFQVICDPADEVIIPVPFWVSFVEQVKLAGGRPVPVVTQRHQLDVDAIEQAVSPRTKAILINSPNNPSGAVYPMNDLQKIVRLAEDHDLFIVADEAYKEFVYDGSVYASIFDIAPARERLIVTRSFSKSYSMTGFRIGYVAAPGNIIAALSKMQSHLTGNVCTFAQYGALAALQLDDDWLADRQSRLQQKKDTAFVSVSRLFDCIQPQGAFYLFPDVSTALRNDDTSETLARRLLKEAGVAVVPGEAFGMARHLRISFAVSDENLKTGLKRIAEVL
ncbi:MAG: pyridoxal phosphate-dependent aminotransferase [Deltaproteobacteria bacterium]|jgi:aspartate aminotransferase|nr:pyridoxal phosphate-dependent aminotransferase [Deltaproteobacteria bacterium]